MGEFEFRYYWQILKRHLRWALVIAVACSTFGLTVAYLFPRVFHATSKILIESPQIPSDLARSTVPITGVEQVQVIEQQMKTSANLLELADEFQIFANRKDMSESDIVAAMRARTTFTQIALQVSGPNATTAFEVSFDAPDPQLAARVSSKIATDIVDQNNQLRAKIANETLGFFEQDAKRLNLRLSQLEAEILAFKNQNKEALPDSLDFRRNQQTTFQERLLQLQREEASLRDRRTTLINTFQETGRTPSQQREQTPEEQVLAELTKKLLEQQLVYSEQSSTIKSLRAQIAKVQEAIKAQRSSQQAPQNTAKPVSELDVQLAEIDARLNYIAQERKNVDDDLKRVTATITATPANAMSLNALEREYQNTQQQYSQVTSKMADAATGAQIELRSKGVKFSIIELAEPPQSPLRSKRYAIAGSGLFGGILLGLAFIFLREFLTPGVRRPVDLERQLNLKPFIAIPYIYTKAERRWKWTVFVIAMLISLFAIPAAIAAIHTQVMPIDQMMDKATRALGRGNN